MLPPGSKVLAGLLAGLVVVSSAASHAMEFVSAVGYGECAFASADHVAIDASGNRYAIGRFSGSCSFGGDVLPNAGYQDLFLMKTDSHLGHLWSKSFGSPNNESGGGVAVDDLGNVVIVGEFKSMIDFGGGPITPVGTQDAFIAKFGPQGNHLWSIGIPATQRCEGVAIDAGGNIFIAGTFWGSMEIGGANLVSSGESDVYLAKFDSAGNHVWSQGFGDYHYQECDGLAVGAAGGPYIVGGFYASVDFGDGPLYSAGDWDVFVARFSPDGTCLWSDSYGDADLQGAFDVAVATDGSCVITGCARGTIDFGGGSLASAGARDVFVAKFDGVGAHQWSGIYGGTGEDSGYGIDTGVNGSVAVAGTVVGSGIFDFGGGPIVGAASQNLLVLKLSSAGEHITSRLYGDDESQMGHDVAAAPDGDICVAGYFRGELDFGSEPPMTAGASFGAFLATFNDSTRYSLTVTQEVRPAHRDDEFLDPAPPLPGAVVRLVNGGTAATAATDTLGFASLVVPEGVGYDFEIDLSGPYSHVSAVFNDGVNEPQDPVSETFAVAANGGHTEYLWRAGPAPDESPALQAAFFIERFRTLYWRDRLGYDWTLPSWIGVRPDDAVVVRLLQNSLALLDLGGGGYDDGAAISFLPHKALESSVVYHEFGHAIIDDRIKKLYDSHSPDARRIGNDAESKGIDEALADYFAASFANDPVIEPCNSFLCKPLRDLTDFWKYPTEEFRYTDYHAASVILSGALWDLRGLVDGIGAGSAPVTDALVFSALDTMLVTGPANGFAFRFDDVYVALKNCDAFQGGIYAAEIDAAFGAHNLGNQQVPFMPLSWQVDDAITDVVDTAADAIEITWTYLEGATYEVRARLTDWSSGGAGLTDGYIPLATGLTDTFFVYTSRDPHTDYLLAVVPVDAATGDVGFMSDPVLVKAANPANVPDSIGASPRLIGGRWDYCKPNPFNPVTTLHFTTEVPGTVSIVIHDLAGRRVRELVSRVFPAGANAVTWEGLDDSGRPCGSGLYFAVLRGSDWRDTGKLMLLK